MPVGLMLSQMGSREFSEWMVFDAMESIGQHRGDMQAAVVAQTVAEVNRDSKRRKRPFSLLDFMPIQYAAKRAKRTWKDIEREMRAAFGG